MSTEKRIKQVLANIKNIDINIYGRSNNIRETKPFPNSILNICKDLKVKPENTMMIGDSFYDILAANNANSWSICRNYKNYSIKIFK